MTEYQEGDKNELSQREKELADLNEELEAQHEELSAAIETLLNKNNHLESTLEELTLRNKEIEQIVYHTSHDLKSPITSIQGLLRLISKDNGKEIIHEYTQHGLLATQNMLHRLDMLRRYSQHLVEDLRTSQVSLKKLWRDVSVAIEKHENCTDVEIGCIIEGADTFTTDANRLYLVLFNIIENSLVFRDKTKSSEVKIAMKNTGNLLKLRIEDNGIGIDQSALAEVSQMFFRASKQSKGVGMGLYLCQRTVQLLEGKMDIESQLGEGTKVIIEIPIMS